MTDGYKAARCSLTIALLGATGLAITGCELIPGLISGSSGPPPADSEAVVAALHVTVEAVEGEIEGRGLDADLVDPSGVRDGESLQFDLPIPAARASIRISTAGTESSVESPYGGRLPVDGGPLGDIGVDLRAPPRATIVACSTAGCREATDFELDVAQQAEGRALVLDATWAGGDRVHLEMRYRELR